MCSASRWSGCTLPGRPLLESHLHAARKMFDQSQSQSLLTEFSEVAHFSSVHTMFHTPPPSSQGDLGAAPSGLHLSARSMLPWVASKEGVVAAGEGVSPPELGLTGVVTPFLLTTFRKAVLPIF